MEISVKEDVVIVDIPKNQRSSLDETWATGLSYKTSEF